ncbi:MAG: NAD(P)-dependent alcohol dehydrogenase [Rhodospirillaceae bacterium]
MKAWVIGKQAGLNSLEMKEHDVPIAGYGEAVIAVKACALNHRDLMIVSNRYGGSKPEYRIPLSDMAGEVVSVGEGAAKVKPGDRVSAAHFTAWIDGDWEPEYLNNDLGNSADGVLAERIVVPAHCLFKLPKNLTYEQGATLPVAGATVWSCVQKLGGIKAGDTVLLLGTGGVSVFGLQIAKMNGARAVITSSSDEKLERMKILGADITINYRSNPEWEREVIEKTGGVDIVVETGGTGTLGQSMASCAPNGRIGLIGALSQGEQPRLSNLLGKNLVLKGITSGSRRMLQDFVNAIEVNGLDPVIDRVFDFDQARQAYGHLDSGSHIGKVVIKI